MDAFLQMRIFFVVTTVSVVVVSLLLSAALVYIVRILHRADKISTLVEEEAGLVRSDIREMRIAMKAEGFKWTFMLSSIRKMIRRFMERTRT